MNKQIILAGLVIAAGASIGVGISVTGASGGAGAGPVAPSDPSPVSTDPTVTRALGQMPSQSTMVSTLQGQDVGVTVDGTALSLPAISSHVLGYMANDIEAAGTAATESGTDVGTAVDAASSETPALQQAVAFETLSQLLYDAAATQGQVASTQAAQAYAQQNYRMYVSSYDDPSPYTPTLPPPNESDFDSAAAIQNYRYTLTVDQEMQQVVGAVPASTQGPDATPAGPGGSSGSTGTPNGTPALQAWMTAQLASNPVQVTGVPGVTGSNLASFLPSGLGG